MCQHLHYIHFLLECKKTPNTYSTADHSGDRLSLQ